MIVGLAGRMGSGKSTLSNELLNRGFKKIAFADVLKKSLAITYDIDLHRMYDLKSKSEKLDKKIYWNKFYSDKLFKICNVNDFNLPIENKEFSTLRELMQYVGSDVLRVYDKDFHVKKTIENLNMEENYVFDDFRFPNELESLQKLNAKCYYILRPNNSNISNHISEISLNWTQFSNHIINDGNLNGFVKSFTSYEYKINDKYNIFSFLYPDALSSYFAGILKSCGNIKVHNNKPFIEISANSLNLIESFSDYVGSHNNILYENNTYNLRFYSPYIIENLKYWNITENKNDINHIPDIIKNNEKYIKYLENGLNKKDFVI